MLGEDAADEKSAHDFGKDILPKAISGNLQVFAYPFQGRKDTRAKLLARCRYDRTPTTMRVSSSFM